MATGEQRGLFEALIGDGRPLLAVTAIALFFSGGFAILQSTSGYLLPHDAEAIGMDAAMLTRAGNQHLTHFLFHDRVAFGGTLLAIGTAYWWLSEFPLRTGKPWAWWALLLSGVFGFLSFLAYLGYGYLDTWHAVATLFLLPTFTWGLYRCRSCLREPLRWRQIWRTELLPENRLASRGRLLILLCAAGLTLAGMTIVFVGMTSVFVPQDLEFMGLTRTQLQNISPLLIPVIAHDRAGFGGGLLSTGLLIGVMARHAPMTLSFLETTALMGLFGFGAALGVHVAIGYLDWTHLVPAYFGFLMFLTGVVLCGLGLARAKRTVEEWPLNKLKAEA